MKGDLEHVNAIPFAGLPAFGGANTTAIGSGYTPEGIDQNPVYYEIVAQQAFRDGPIKNLTAHVVDRARRRYGLGGRADVPEVDAAWAALVGSTYAQDLSVQDGTAVAHLPGSDTSQFLPDRATPTPRLCATFRAWEALLGAAAKVGDSGAEVFRYDLVNLGRELLAQLTTPVSHNFSDALKADPLVPADLTAAGGKYAALLRDVDALVATDAAFLVGPVLAAARAWGAGAADCSKGATPASCGDFYEWNARTQITTWIPVPQGAPAIPDGPDDYAAKHWAGLIADFYAVRAERILAQALSDAAAGRPLNATAVAQLKADRAYAWQNDVTPYPTQPVGDAVDVSVEMMAKWGGAYAPYCQ
jgi:alpha-N-acetylglucosaminidase